MKYGYIFKSGRHARAWRAKARSARWLRGVCARTSGICYNSDPNPRRLESFRLAVWRQGCIPSRGLGLLAEAQFISRASASFPCCPSFHSVLPEDDAVGVSLELLAEHVRVERHLVRGDLHDAEAVEEPAPLVPVCLRELVVGRGVPERGARVAVDVREHDVDVVLVQGVEARALEEDAPELLVIALDVRLLRRAVRVAVEDLRARHQPVRVVVRAGVLGHDGVGERGPVVLEDRGEERHEQRPSREAVEHVDDAGPRLGGLALLVEGHHELARELDREEHASAHLALERVGLGHEGPRVLLLPEDEEVVRPVDAALRVRLRRGLLRAGPARAGVGEVSAPDVERVQAVGADVVVDGPLAEASERVRVRRHDVADGLVAEEPVLQGGVHLRKRLVRGVDVAARDVQLRLAVCLGDLGDVELLREVADALVRAAVADEGRGDEPVARARLVVPALEEALVAVLAPLVHAAVRVADVRAPALPVPPARRVRLLESLAGVDPPVLDFVGDGLGRPLHVGCDLWDRPPAPEPVFDSVSFDSGHLCHVSILSGVGIPARRRARPSCQAGEYSGFAEVNEGHPLGDDSREILCSPPIICKENQCPLKN